MRVLDNNDVNVITNPAFDPHIIVRGIQGTALTRGRIVQDATNSPAQGNKLYTLNFLYNPDSIQLSYSIDFGDSTPIQPQYRNPDDTANLPIPLANTLSFGLLFDRTYDLWNGNSTAGVYDDVAVLYGLIGVTSSVQAPTFTLDSSGAPQKSSDTVPVTGPMQMNTNYFYFGGKSSLSFYGIIMSATITYTHWTIDMVPSRCSIGISTQLLSTDADIQKRLTVPNRNTSDFLNNSSAYDNFLQIYAGPVA